MSLPTKIDFLASLQAQNNPTTVTTPKDDNVNDMCPICYNTLDVPTSTSCQYPHIFCQECIVLWLSTHRCCPTCRTPQYDDPGHEAQDAENEYYDEDWEEDEEEEEEEPALFVGAGFFSALLPELAIELPRVLKLIREDGADYEYAGEYDEGEIDDEYYDEDEIVYEDAGYDSLTVTDFVLRSVGTTFAGAALTGDEGLDSDSNIDDVPGL